MANRIVKLTEQQFKDIIHNAVLSFMNEFVDITFRFYTYDSLRNTAIIRFKPADIKKLEKRKAILKGDVTFDNTKLNGNLIVFLDTKKVVYNHPDKHRYTLELDNRFLDKWNKLIDKLDETEQNLPH